MNLKETYRQDDFIQYLRSFIPGFSPDIRPVAFNAKLKAVTEASYLGQAEELDLSVFQLKITGSADKKLAHARDGFRIMKEYHTYRALMAYFSDEDQNWRLSLMQMSPELGESGRVVTKISNPRRYSFYLGPQAKTKTPEKYLLKEGKAKDFEDLLKRFSVEVVNKDFYKDIATFYNRLVGGDIKVGTKTKHFEREVDLPSVQTDNRTLYQEFAVRLIGRIIFCWFLKQKKSQNEISLLPDEFLSAESVTRNEEYYHTVLEKIFFEVLNKPIKERSEQLSVYRQIPYLNGGLFDPQSEDFYENQANWGLKIPDQWFRELFEVLETYNFTIDENTVLDTDLSIDPEMLGRIFENLLAEINPETGQSARKATGSYYTPRPIVEYMVDQSLLHYLKSKTSVEVDKIKALISINDLDDELYPLNKEDRHSIIEALDKIKIIDPACGSGAFPIGMLQKIVFMLGKVDQNGRLWFEKKTENLDALIKEDFLRKFEKENFDYIRKTGIIRDSIYGVDIQPVAVEVSKLRSFLTLMVDEDVDDTAENRGIKPLPNLEFKFIVANSLVGLPGQDLERKQIGMFEENQEIEELKKIRDQYFVSSGLGKERIRSRFKDIQRKMFRNQIAKRGQGQMTVALADWDPFHRESSGWFDPEWMFGVSKFDVVIANPPYIGEKGHKELFREIKNNVLGRFYNGKMDLFYFFFHLALDLGQKDANIIFITTNYYPTAMGARKLRKDFKDRGVIQSLINFNEFKIFESALGQHNMITHLIKASDTNAMAHTCITSRRGIATAEALQQILDGVDPQSQYHEIAQKDLYDGKENYIRLGGKFEVADNPLQNILNKIRAEGVDLVSVYNVNNGIFAGADFLSESKKLKYKIDAPVGTGIFILTAAEVDALNLTTEEQRMVKPLYKNSDIGKYFTNNENKYFILNLRYTDRPNLNQYPHIKKHLLQFERLLSDRPKTGTLESAFNNGYWYVMSTSRRVNMDGEKIVAPQRSRTNTFGYNEIPWYASADVYFITKKNENYSLKYLLALLNSKLCYMWLYHRGKRKGEILELYQQPLSEIPVKKISPDAQKPFVQLIDKIFSIKFGTHSDDEKRNEIQTAEDQINKLVYRLYGLTEEEVVLVEGGVV